MDMEFLLALFAMPALFVAIGYIVKLFQRGKEGRDWQYGNEPPGHGSRR